MKIEHPAIISAKEKSSKMTLQFWSSDAVKLTAIIPSFTLSEKAKVDSISLFLAEKWVKRLDLNSPLDLSVLKDVENDYIQYTISAEDPNKQTIYKIAADRLLDPSLVFTMDKWSATGEPEGLASSNQATGLLPIFGIFVPKPVAKSDDGIVRIVTSRTDAIKSPSTLVPAITAGTMFTGTFNMNFAMSNQLKCTQFGIPYRDEPKTFKVIYKYTPGPQFFHQIVVDSLDKKGKVIKDNVAELVSGRTDECSINAYLYEVSSYDETLDGTNINDPDNTVIMKALLPNGKATTEYTTQDISFEPTGKGSYDPSKKYKIAIVCSSSKDGDKFEGAPESTLYIKHLEVTAK